MKDKPISSDTNTHRNILLYTYKYICKYITICLCIYIVIKYIVAYMCMCTYTHISLYINTIIPLYPRILHPWFQPTMDWKYLFWPTVSCICKCRTLRYTRLIKGLEHPQILIPMGILEPSPLVYQEMTVYVYICVHIYFNVCMCVCVCMCLLDIQIKCSQDKSS